jgi:all-trans-retinol dehydrogenase (NAD+)
MLETLCICSSWSFIIFLLIASAICYKIYCDIESRPKKHFVEKTNILITGAVQGLGKLLAEKFASEHEHVNLICLDIADTLVNKLLKDVKSVRKSDTVGVHFYKINLANQAEIDSVWERVTKEHGPIHILINNAAICLG